MVTDAGATLSEARAKALKDARTVAENSQGLFYRSDIGAAESRNEL